MNIHLCQVPQGIWGNIYKYHTSIVHILVDSNPEKYLNLILHQKVVVVWVTERSDVENRDRMCREGVVDIDWTRQSAVKQ